MKLKFELKVIHNTLGAILHEIMWWSMFEMASSYKISQRPLNNHVSPSSLIFLVTFSDDNRFNQVWDVIFRSWRPCNPNQRLWESTEGGCGSWTLLLLFWNRGRVKSERGVRTDQPSAEGGVPDPQLDFAINPVCSAPQSVFAPAAAAKPTMAVPKKACVIGSGNWWEEDFEHRIKFRQDGGRFVVLRIRFSTQLLYLQTCATLPADK